MTLTKWSVLAIICSSLTACQQPVAFQHPLLPPDEAQLDRDIFGTWYYQVESEEGETATIFLHIGSADRPGLVNNDWNISEADKPDQKLLPRNKLTRVTVVKHSENGQVDCMSFLVYSVQLGDLKYVNLPLVEKGKIQQYYVQKYDLQGERLLIWDGMDREALEMMIFEKKLHKNQSSLMITDDSKHLRQILESGGDEELFLNQEKTVFRKLKSIK